MDDQPMRGTAKTQDKQDEKPDDRRSSSQSNDQLDRARTMASDTIDQAKTMARNVGEQVRSAASGAAQDLGQQARDQASAAGDMLYQQGARAGEYLTRNVNEYPLAALLIAGAIGYGIGYLIHAGWKSE